MLHRCIIVSNTPMCITFFMILAYIRVSKEMLTKFHLICIYES